MNNYENKTTTKPMDDGFDTKLKQAVRVRERDKIHTYLDELENLQDKVSTTQGVHKQVRKFPLRRILAYAAGVIMLAVAAILFLQPEIFQPSNKLAKAYYKPYPNVYKPITRGQNPNVDNEMLALAAYEAEQYELALNLLRKLEQRNDYIELFTAISHWETGNQMEASKMLTELLSRDSELERTALWYQSLFALESGEKEEAKEYLQQLVNESDERNSDFKKEAVEILKSL